jgi:hypothetical protein
MDVWIIEINDTGKWRPLGSCLYLTFEEAENEKLSLYRISAQWSSEKHNMRVRAYRRV